MQRAVDRLDGRGVLTLDRGRFLLPETLRVDGEIEIWGAGWNATRVIYHGPSSAIQVNSGEGVTTKKWLIGNLTIDGKGLGARGVTIGQTVTSPLSAHKGGMQNVHITGFTEAGLYLEASQINRFWNVDLSGNPGNGLHVQTPLNNSNTDTAFSGCFFRRNGGCGIYAQDGGHFSFRDCICEQNGHEGVWLHKVRVETSNVSWLFDRLYCEHNNHQRPGSGWAQFKVSNEAGFWKDMSLLRPYLWGAGTDNDHFQMGKVFGVIEYPIFDSPRWLGRDTEAGMDLLIRTRQKTPLWTPGGTGVTWLVESGRYRKTFIPDGAGGWAEVD